MIVTNNGYGISTPAKSQHAEGHISDRGVPFDIPGDVVNGNDPVATWHALEKAEAAKIRFICAPHSHNSPSMSATSPSNSRDAGTTLA